MSSKRKYEGPKIVPGFYPDTVRILDDNGLIAYCMYRDDIPGLIERLQAFVPKLDKDDANLIELKREEAARHRREAEHPDNEIVDRLLARATKKKKARRK